MWEIAVLGPIEAFEDGEPVDLGGPTQRKVLATLVAFEGDAVSVPRLLEALWGDEPPPSGPSTVQSYVSRLRGALDPDAIETTTAGYRLRVEEVAIDAMEFLETARNLPDENPERLESIEAALALWRGAPFEGFEHLEFASRHLAETRVDLRQEKALLLSDLGRASEAIGILEWIISEEPYRESGWIALARTLASEGRLAEAVRTLDKYRSKLADIGLEPSADFSSTQDELFARDKPAPPEDSPLPAESSTLHGRAAEREQLGSMMSERRLVTVVGHGGMGKTRLATATAADIDQRKWLVRLEGVREDSGVMPAVLAELGIESRGDPLSSVVEALRHNPGLLILDNCEHVIASAARLADEVVRDTQASVLATSREPLNIPGESLFELGPLDAKSASSLYVDRAKDVNPGFSADIDQIGELCSKLDFMPLAIEIAASRSRALGPNDILDLLDRKYGILDKPRRQSDLRHQTLDAMVDWSYSLLAPRTKRVFERLSAFVGVFNLQAATTVAGFGEIEPEEVPARVADLVERSMLQKADSTGAFRMLRVFKDFAAERLSESSDQAQVGNLHMTHYVSVSTEIGDGMIGPEEAKWVRTAHQGVEDIGLALEWAVEHGDLDSVELILEGLFHWLYHRQPPAIMDWGQFALEQVSAGQRAYSIASAWAATAALKRGDPDRALQIAQSATTSDPDALSAAWFIAGDVACYIGDMEQSMFYYEKTLRRARATEDDVAVVDALSRLMLSMVRNEGMFEEAMARAEELSKLLGRIDAPSSHSHADFALGSALAGLDLDEARERLSEALDLSRSVENRYVEGMALSEMGSVLALDGQLDAARDTLLKAIEVFHQLGQHPHEWTTLRYLAAVLARSGSPEVAGKLLAAADASGIDSLGSQVSLWSEEFRELRATRAYRNWADKGKELTLQRAVALATGE